MRPGADVPATISLQPGGQGANVAVRLARLGVPVDLVCAIGDDAAGTLVRHALAADGVTVVELPADASGTVVVLAGDAGERTMLSQRPVSATAAAGLEWKDHDWVVASGYVLAEPGADPLAALVASMRRRVVLGCTLTEAQVGPWSDRVSSIRPDLLVLNRDEARALRPLPRATISVVTDADGARALLGGDEVAVDGVAGVHATDTTGAGDAFAAALVAGLMLVPWPPTAGTLRAAMTAGVQLAAQVARVTGAQAHVPSETGGTSQ
jgi:sugar/nucleoside kinase (ribokinase family)